MKQVLYVPYLITDQKFLELKVFYNRLAASLEALALLQQAHAMMKQNVLFKANKARLLISQ